MDWWCKIRERSVRLKVLEDVRAIRPAGGLLNTIVKPLLSFLSFLSGDAVSDSALVDMVGDFAVSRRRLFSNAGWHFVYPSREISIVAKIRNAAQTHHVYTTDSGNLMI